MKSGRKRIIYALSDFLSILLQCKKWQAGTDLTPMVSHGRSWTPMDTKSCVPKGGKSGTPAANQKAVKVTPQATTSTDPLTAGPTPLKIRFSQWLRTSFFFKSSSTSRTASESLPPRSRLTGITRRIGSLMTEALTRSIFIYTAWQSGQKSHSILAKVGNENEQ
jgi:hypothetical protein